MSKFDRFISGDVKPTDDLNGYQLALQNIANEHNYTSGQVALEYANSLEDWLRYIPEKRQATDFAKLLVTLGDNVGRVTGLTEQNAGTVLDISAKVFPALLSDRDNNVFERVITEASAYGPGSLAVARTLDVASGPNARAAMKGLLPKPESRTSGRRSVFDDFFERRYDIPNMDDLLRDAYARQNPGAGQTNAGTTRKARDEAPRQPVDLEVERIIRTAARTGNGTGWLLGEDRTAVRRVINTVLAARESARQAGKEISDRDIYLRYVRLVNVPESEKAQKAKMKSFHILQALMGGSPNGKLPF